MQSLDKLTNHEKEKILEDAWSGLIFTDETLFNPLKSVPLELEDTPHLFYTFLMTRPEYFSFVCSEFLNVDLLPFQALILEQLWNHKFPMLIASRGLGKTFLLAVYSILRTLLIPDREVVVAGAGFRQSKLVYEYVNKIWNNAPLLRDCVRSYSKDQGPKGGNDAVYFYIGASRVIFIPVGTGQTIRGLRGDVIVDEFASHNKQIFENVISGFGAVNASPQERVKDTNKKLVSKQLGLDVHDDHKKFDENQIIISGTAYYHFNHFAEYWEKWREIIKSQGDPNKLEEIFPEGAPDEFDYKDYCVIRLPYQLAPHGFMDQANIARSKVTLNKSLFDLEFNACFSKDSSGFFKATLIESCVASPENQIIKSSGEVHFLPKLSGNDNSRYYMGIDTASQVDNFAIVIIEAREDHRRIVYSWTTNAKEFKEAKKHGQIEETDFFRYCSRKIRNLMDRFNIYRIAIDSQGGGWTIYESLHDKDNLKNGEQMLWEIIEENKSKDTDNEDGLHIIEMVNFRKQDYTSSANHNMKKDFEERMLLFPEYNPAVLATYSNLENAYFQEMEDCIDSIEGLKRELTQIELTATANGNERFDTPDIKISGSQKGKMKKDRYSALIMANTSARSDHYNKNSYASKTIGDLANTSLNSEKASFIGPSWITNKLNSLY